MPDSLSIDTIIPAPKVVEASAPDPVLRMPRTAVPHPFDADLDHALGAMVADDQLDMSAFEAIAAEASAPPAWTAGHEPEPRVIHPAGHSAVLSVLALLFVACLLAYSYFRRAIATGVHDLWSLRRRSNAFDESSPGRRRVQLLLALQFAAYGGVLLYAAFSPGPVPDTAGALADTLRLTGLAAAYYVFQMCAYATVGYTFAPDGARARQFVDGFHASQGLAGLALALPTLGLVFYPDASMAMLITAAGIYIAARLIFISKGFRIFFTGFTSLVYFILYLCTLEIVPVLCVYGIARSIVGQA